MQNGMQATSQRRATGVAYADQHDIQGVLTRAVNEVLSKRPEKPISHLGHALLQHDGREDKEASALREEVKRLREELQRVRAADVTRDASTFKGQADGELRGVNGLNQALWKMGAIQHEPPVFRYFDPDLEEKFPALMKEIRLPLADETHEVCFEPVSRCLFVSQMTNSVLVRIPVGADGLLLDDQDAWMVGPTSKEGIGISGLRARAAQRSPSPHTNASRLAFVGAACAFAVCVQTTSPFQFKILGASGFPCSSQTRWS